MRPFARLLVTSAVLAPFTGELLAQAQPVMDPIDIEIPVVVLEPGDTVDQTIADDTDLDLANIVQSAAKGVTTVQEAPAIVTVVTQDEIKDRQLQSLEQIVDTVPGWIRLGAIHSQFPFPLTRGQLQAALFLHDGVSLFDPFLNVPTVSRVQSVEMIKRVELINGPGGVLWGANSLLGIINVITKDAEDVDGVEANVTLGDGNGDRSVLRAYMMVGVPNLLGGKAKAFAHASFESYIGPGFEMPAFLFSTPVPQPNSLSLYGPLTRADPKRSYIINLDGKLTLGKLQLRGQYPFVERHSPLGFPGWVVQKELPEDVARDPATGDLVCPNTPPIDDPSDLCADKARVSRDNQPNFFDRYIVAEYRDRLARGSAGISLKGYLTYFSRKMEPLGAFTPIPTLLEGGLTFESPISSYRSGGSFDGDLELPGGIRLLYGTEAFHEWGVDNVTRSRQGDGIQATFRAPYDLSRLPLPCPRDVDEMGEVTYITGCPVTMAFPSSRTVLGAYLNPQWRPTKRLILDAGARLQVAPAELGLLSYPLAPTFGGAAVYNVVPGWHIKLNLTQGFRPPIFNQLVSNGEAVVIDGDANLALETSTAAQAEINARIFKGQRRIRELNFRADYSYTLLKNLIQIAAGRYVNSSDRGIHTVEFLGNLYMQGGHRLEASYTWLRVETADVGLHRSLPENWINLGMIFNLIDERLTATGTLRVIGAMEDPNRMVEYRDHAYNELGRVIDKETKVEDNVVVGTSEVVMDRLPPVAEIAMGMTWLLGRHLELQATVQNALNARFYQPDAFFSYEPRFEYLPNPAEDVRGYVSATYHY